MYPLRKECRLMEAPEHRGKTQGMGESRKKDLPHGPPTISNPPSRRSDSQRAAPAEQLSSTTAYSSCSSSPSLSGSSAGVRAPCSLSPSFHRKRLQLLQTIKGLQSLVAEIFFLKASESSLHFTCPCREPREKQGGDGDEESCGDKRKRREGGSGGNGGGAQEGEPGVSRASTSCGCRYSIFTLPADSPLGESSSGGEDASEDEEQEEERETDSRQHPPPTPAESSSRERRPFLRKGKSNGGVENRQEKRHHVTEEEREEQRSLPPEKKNQETRSTSDTDTNNAPSGTSRSSARQLGPPTGDALVSKLLETVLLPLLRKAITSLPSTVKSCLMGSIERSREEGEGKDRAEARREREEEEERQRRAFFFLQVAELRCLLRVLSGLLTGRIDRVAPRGLSTTAIRRIAEAACLVLSLPAHLLLESSSASGHSSGAHRENKEKKKEGSLRGSSSQCLSLEDAWGTDRRSSGPACVSDAGNPRKSSSPPTTGLSFLSSSTSCEQRDILGSLLLHVKEDWGAAVIDCLRVLRNYLQMPSEKQRGVGSESAVVEDAGRCLGLLHFEAEAVDCFAFLARRQQSALCTENGEVRPGPPLFSRTWRSLLSLVERKSSACSVRGSQALLLPRIFVTAAYVHPATIALHQTLLFQIFQEGRLPLVREELFSQACAKASFSRSSSLSLVAEEVGSFFLHSGALQEDDGVGDSLGPCGQLACSLSGEGSCETMWASVATGRPSRVNLQVLHSRASLTQAVCGLLGTVVSRGSSGLEEACAHLCGIAIEGALECVGNLREIQEQRRRRGVQTQRMKRKRCFSSSGDLDLERQGSLGGKASSTSNLRGIMGSDETSNTQAKRACREDKLTRQSSEEDGARRAEEVRCFDGCRGRGWGESIPERGNATSSAEERALQEHSREESELRTDSSAAQGADWGGDFLDRMETKELRLLDHWLRDIVRLNGMANCVGVRGRAGDFTGGGISGRATSSGVAFSEYQPRLRLLIREMHDIALLPAAAFNPSGCRSSPRTVDQVTGNADVSTREPADEDDGEIFLFGRRQHGVQKENACPGRIDLFYLVPRQWVPFLPRMVELLRVWLPLGAGGAQKETFLQGSCYGEEEALVEWVLERWTSARCFLDSADNPAEEGMGQRTPFCNVVLPRWTVPPEAVEALKTLLPEVKDAFLRAEMLLALPFLLLGIDESESPEDQGNPNVIAAADGEDAGRRSRPTREVVMAPTEAGGEVTTFGALSFYLLGAIRCEGRTLEDSEELFSACVQTASEEERQGLRCLLMRRLDAVSSLRTCAEWRAWLYPDAAWDRLSSFHFALLHFASRFLLSSFSPLNSGLAAEGFGGTPRGPHGFQEPPEETPLVRRTAPGAPSEAEDPMRHFQLRHPEGEEDARTIDPLTVLRQRIVDILWRFFQKERRALQVDAAEIVDSVRESLSPSILERLVDLFCSAAGGLPVPSSDCPGCLEDSRTEETGADCFASHGNDSTEGDAGAQSVWLSNFFREELMFHLGQICSSTSGCAESEAPGLEEESLSLLDLCVHSDGLCCPLTGGRSPEIYADELVSRFSKTGATDNGITRRSGEVGTETWDRIRTLLRAVAMDPVRSAEERLDFVLWEVFPETLLSAEDPSQHEGGEERQKSVALTKTRGSGSSCFRRRLSSWLQFCVLNWGAWLFSVVSSSVPNAEPKRRRSLANALSIFLSFLCASPAVSRSSLRVAICQLFPFLLSALSPPSCFSALLVGQCPAACAAVLERGFCSQGHRTAAALALSTTGRLAGTSQGALRMQGVGSSRLARLLPLFRQTLEEALSCCRTAISGDGGHSQPLREPWPPPFTYGCWLGLLLDRCVPPVPSAAEGVDFRTDSSETACSRSSPRHAQEKYGDAARNEADCAYGSLGAGGRARASSLGSSLVPFLCPFCDDTFEKEYSSLSRFTPSGQSRAAGRAPLGASSDGEEPSSSCSVLLPVSVAAPHVVTCPFSPVHDTKQRAHSALSSGIPGSVVSQRAVAPRSSRTCSSADSRIGARGTIEPAEVEGTLAGPFSSKGQQYGVEERCCSKCKVPILLLREPLVSVEHQGPPSLSDAPGPGGPCLSGGGHDLALHGDNSLLVSVLRLLRAAVTSLLSLSKTHPLYCSMAAVLSHLEPVADECRENLSEQWKSEALERALSLTPGAPILFSKCTSSGHVFKRFLAKVAIPERRGLGILHVLSQGDAGEAGSERWKAHCLADQEAISVAVLAVLMACLSADCSGGITVRDDLGVLPDRARLDRGRPRDDLFFTGEQHQATAGTESGKIVGGSRTTVQAGRTPEKTVQEEKPEPTEGQDSSWSKGKETKDGTFASALKSCALMLLYLIRFSVRKNCFSALPGILPSLGGSAKSCPHSRQLLQLPGGAAEDMPQTEGSPSGGAASIMRPSEVRRRVESRGGPTLIQEDSQDAPWPWLLPTEGPCSSGRAVLRGRKGSLAREILLALVTCSDGVLRWLLISAVLDTLRERAAAKTVGTDSSSSEYPSPAVAGQGCLGDPVECVSSMESLVSRARLAVLFGGPLLRLCDSMTIASRVRSSSLSSRKRCDQKGASYIQLGAGFLLQEESTPTRPAKTKRPAGSTGRHGSGGTEPHAWKTGRCLPDVHCDSAWRGGNGIVIACCSGTLARLEQASAQSGDFRRLGLLASSSSTDLPGIIKTLTGILAPVEYELSPHDVVREQSAPPRAVDRTGEVTILCPERRSLDEAGLQLRLLTSRRLPVCNACCCEKPSPSFQLFAQLLQTGECERVAGFMPRVHLVGSEGLRDLRNSEIRSGSPGSDTRGLGGSWMAITALGRYRKELMDSCPASGVFLPLCQNGSFSSLWCLNSPRSSGRLSAQAAVHLKDALAAVYAGATAAASSEPACEFSGAAAGPHTGAGEAGGGASTNAHALAVEAGSRAVNVAMRYFELVSGSVGLRAAPASMVQACCGEGGCCLDAVFALFFSPAISSSTAWWHADDTPGCLLDDFSSGEGGRPEAFQPIRRLSPAWCRSILMLFVGPSTYTLVLQGRRKRTNLAAGSPALSFDERGLLLHSGKSSRLLTSLSVAAEHAEQELCGAALLPGLLWHAGLDVRCLAESVGLFRLRPQWDVVLARLLLSIPHMCGDDATGGVAALTRFLRLAAQQTPTWGRQGALADHPGGGSGLAQRKRLHARLPPQTGASACASTASSGERSSAKAVASVRREPTATSGDVDSGEVAHDRLCLLAVVRCLWSAADADKWTLKRSRAPLSTSGTAFLDLGNQGGHSPNSGFDADRQAEGVRAWLRSRLALLYCARVQAEGKAAVAKEDRYGTTPRGEGAVGKGPTRRGDSKLGETAPTSDEMDVDEEPEGRGAEDEVARTEFSDHSGTRAACESSYHGSSLGRGKGEGLEDKSLEDFLTPHLLEIEELLLHCIFPRSLGVPPAAPQYLTSYLRLFLPSASVPVLIVSLLGHRENHLSSASRKPLWEILRSFLDRERGLRMLFLTISCSHRRLLDTHAARLIDSLQGCFEATQVPHALWMPGTVERPAIKSPLSDGTPRTLQVYFAALRLLILSFSAPTLLSYAPSFLNTLGEFQHCSPDLAPPRHCLLLSKPFERWQDFKLSDRDQRDSCARDAGSCRDIRAEAAELVAVLIARGFEAVEADEVPPSFFYATLACTPVFPPLPSDPSVSFPVLSGDTATGTANDGAEPCVDIEKGPWPSSQYLNEDHRSRFDVASPPSLLPLFSLLLSFIYRPPAAAADDSSPPSPLATPGGRRDDVAGRGCYEVPERNGEGAAPRSDTTGRVLDEQQRQYYWEQREFVSAQMRWPLEVTVVRFAAVAAFLDDVYPYSTRLAAAETLQRLLRVYGTPLVHLLYQARSVEQDWGADPDSLGARHPQEVQQRADALRLSLQLVAKVAETCQAVVAEFCDDYSRQPKALPVTCAALLGLLIPVLSTRPGELGYSSLQPSSRGALLHCSQPTGAPRASAAANALGVNILSRGKKHSSAPPFASPATEGAGQLSRKAEQGSSGSSRDTAAGKPTDCWWRISDDGKLCCELLERVLICNLHLPVAARSTQEVLKVLGFHIHSPKGRLAQMFPALAESFFKGGSGPKSSSGSALSSSSGSPPSSRCGPSSSQASWNTFLADASWSSQAGARIVDPVSLQVKKDSSSPLSLTTGESSPSLSHLEPSPWHTFVWKKVMPSQVRTALLPYCFTSYERVSALRSPVPSVSSRRAGPTVHLGFGRGVEPKSRASLQFGLTTAPARTQGSTEESLLPGGSRVCKRAAALRALIMWMLRRLHHQQAMMSSLQQTPRKSQQAKPRRSISGVGEKLVQPRGPSGGSRASSKQQEVTVISSSSSSSEEEKERPRQLPARPVPAPRGALRLAVFKACDVVLLQLPKVLSFLLPHMTDSFLCTAAEPESAARELSSRITTLLVASTVGPRNEQGCMTEGTEPPSVRDSATGDVHPDNSLAPETSDSHSTCQALFGLLQKLHDWHSWIRGDCLPSLAARIKSGNQEVKSLQNAAEALPGEQGAKTPNRNGEDGRVTDPPGLPRRRARLEIALRRLERYKAQEHRQKVLAHALQTLLRGVDPLLLARAAAGCGAYARALYWIESEMTADIYNPLYRSTSLGIVGLPACIFTFCRAPREKDTRAPVPAASKETKTGRDPFHGSFRLLVEILRGLGAGDALTGLLEVRKLLSTRGGSIPVPEPASASPTGEETPRGDSRGARAPRILYGRPEDLQRDQDAGMDVDMDTGAASEGDETEDDGDFAGSAPDENRAEREVDTVDMRAIESEFDRHWAEAAALYLQGAGKETSDSEPRRDFRGKNDLDGARANGNILSLTGRWAGWFRCITRAGPSAISGLWPSAAALCVSFSDSGALGNDSRQRSPGDDNGKTAFRDPGIAGDPRSAYHFQSKRAVLPGGLVAEATTAYWSLGKWDLLHDLVHAVIGRSVSHLSEGTFLSSNDPQSLPTTKRGPRHSEDAADDGIHAQDAVESWMALQHARLLLAARRTSEKCLLWEGSPASTLYKPRTFHFRSTLQRPVLGDIEGTFAEVAFQAYEQTIRGVVRPLGAALRESRDRAMPLLTRLHILSDFSLISHAFEASSSCCPSSPRLPPPGGAGFPQEGLRDGFCSVLQGDCLARLSRGRTDLPRNSRAQSDVSRVLRHQSRASFPAEPSRLLPAGVGKQLALSSLLLQRASLRCTGERGGENDDGTASDAFHFVLGAAKVALESTNHAIAAAAIAVAMRSEQRRREQLLHVPGSIQFGDHTQVISQAKELWKRTRTAAGKPDTDRDSVLAQTREEKEAVARLVHCMRIEDALQLLDQGQVSEGLQALSLLAGSPARLSFSATVPSAMVLYVQQATKRLLLPAEGAIACFEQAVRQQPESAGVYYQYALFIDSLISTRIEEEKSRPPSLFSHLGQQGHPNPASASAGTNRQPQPAAAGSPSRLAVVPGRTDKADLALPFLVCEAVRLYLKCLCCLPRSRRTNSSSSSPLWWVSSEAEREEAARQQHHSTHRVSALLFTFCTPNTFITPHTRLDLRTCEMYAERLTRVVMRDEGARVPLQYWFEVVEQIACRCQHPLLGRDVCGALLARLMSRYPWRTLWHVVSLGNTVVRDRSRREVLTRTLETIVTQAADMQQRASPATPPCERVIDIYRVAARFAKEMHKVAMDEEIRREDALNASGRYPELYAMFSPDLATGSQIASVAVPTQANLQVGPADVSGGTSSLVTIVSVSAQVQVFPSKQRPKKMTVLGSDGRTYSFLVKNERHGDLRKDSRTMGLAENVNKLLAHDPVCRAKNLRLRTFAVTVLSEVTGMIEWVEGNTTLRKCVWALYHELIPDFPSITAEVVKSFQRAQTKRDHAEAYRIFTQVALNKVPPVMQRLFFKWFSDNPSKWYRARRNYGHTLALWSFFGFIIGLGDRHGENILLDSSNGTVMHVDFDCLLEKGRSLPVPEVVPFRLTQNLVSCLGMTGVEGVFKVAAVNTMGVMRQNRDSLISILMNFVHDPLIEWRQATARHAQLQQQQQRRQGGQSLLGQEVTDGWEKLAYECLVEIEYKLSGGVGVTARSLPPHIPSAVVGPATQHAADSAGSHAGGKAKRSSDARPAVAGVLGEAEGNIVVRGGEGQLSSPSNALPVHDQVQAVVQSAMCLHNLSRMYIGWVPWL